MLKYKNKTKIIQTIWFHRKFKTWANLRWYIFRYAYKCDKITKKSNEMISTKLRMVFTCEEIKAKRGQKDCITTLMTLYLN